MNGLIGAPICKSRNFSSSAEFEKLSKKAGHVYKNYLVEYFTIMLSITSAPSRVEYATAKRGGQCKKYCIQQLSRAENANIDINQLFLKVVGKFTYTNYPKLATVNPRAIISCIQVIIDTWELIQPSLSEQSRLERVNSMVEKITEVEEKIQLSDVSFFPLLS